MVRGFVKKLVSDRGFGFITGQDGVDYFFHRFDTMDFDNLTEGDEVHSRPPRRSVGRVPRTSRCSRGLTIGITQEKTRLANSRVFRFLLGPSGEAPSALVATKQ